MLNSNEYQNLNFYMGLKCNLRCEYCNLEKDYENALIINSFEKFEKALEDRIKKFPNKKIGKILLSGGEPTLFIDEVIKILNKYQNVYKIFIISNGLKEKEILDLAEYNIKFIISYDGHINERGYDSLNIIKKLYNLKKLDSISMVISNKSYLHIYDTLKELKDLFPDLFIKKRNNEGYDGIQISIVRKESSYYDFDLKLFRDIIKNVYLNISRDLEIFERRNNKLCSGFYQFSEDVICSHFNGEIIGNGCYSRINNIKECVDVFENNCSKCDSIICQAGFCPVITDYIKINEEHALCKIFKLISDVVIEVENQERFESMMSYVNNLELVITNWCNMKCKYCFEVSSSDLKIMSRETLKKTIDYFIKFKRNSEYFSITLFGGEPILPQTLDLRLYLIDYLEELNLLPYVKLIIMSNTFNLNENEIIFLNKVKNKFKDYIWQVSLDSIEEYNDINRVSKNNLGTFKNVIKNIKVVSNILGYKHITVNSVTTFENINGLAEWGEYLSKELLNKYISNVSFRIDQTRSEPMTLEERVLVSENYNKVIDYFYEKRITHHVVKSIFNVNRSLYDSELLNKKECGLSCGICYNTISVLENGDILPCHITLNNNEKTEEFIIGNIFSGLRKNAHSILTLCNSGEELYSEYLGIECYKCKNRSSCVRCKIEQYLYSKDINKVLEFTCMHNTQRMDIYKNRLYELFKPYSEEERQEIINGIVDLKLLYDENNSEEILDFLKEIEEEVEFKKWFF